MYEYTGQNITIQKFNLLPKCSQNGTVPSFWAKYGPLKLYLYSNLLCGSSQITKSICKHIIKSVKIILTALNVPEKKSRRPQMLF